MMIADVRCVKSDNPSFVVGSMYEVVVGLHGDKTIEADSGYTYNLNKNLQHSANLAFELVDIT